MQINRLRDFVERVGWTALQAGAASAIVALSADNIDWGDAAQVTGIAALIAALKVIAAQQIGNRGSGDAIPGGVEETP